MKPFIEGKHAYQIRRVPNPAWPKPDTHFGYQVDWRVYWPLTGWRWFQRDDIGFCATRKEARYLIGLFEMQDGIARVHRPRTIQRGRLSMNAKWTKGPWSARAGDDRAQLQDDKR